MHLAVKARMGTDLNALNCALPKPPPERRDDLRDRRARRLLVLLVVGGAFESWLVVAAIDALHAVISR